MRKANLRLVLIILLIEIIIVAVIRHLQTSGQAKPGGPASDASPHDIPSAAPNEITPAETLDDPKAQFPHRMVASTGEPSRQVW